MSPQLAQQKFSLANTKFLEGYYEESLALLDELVSGHPGVFNLEYPRLLCLERLERLNEVKELFSTMTLTYVQPGEQERLREVGEWIAEQESSNMSHLSGLDLGLDDILGSGNQIDDLLGLSPPRQKTEPPRPAANEEHHTHHYKSIAAAVIGVIVIILAIIYLPDLLKPTPPFSAGIYVGLPYGKIEGNIYRKNNEIMRMEMMGQVIIKNKDHVYVLIPSEKVYSEMEVDDLVGASMIAELENFDDWIVKRGVKVVGKETLYGLECDIYQGQLSMNPSLPSSETKVWWSPVLEFPVKSETISSGLLSRMVMFMKDLKIDTFPESFFLPPPNYKQVSAEVTRNLGADLGIGFGPGMAALPTPSAPPPRPSFPAPSTPPSGYGTPPTSLSSSGTGSPPPGTNKLPDNSQNMNAEALEKLKQQINSRR